MIAVDTNVLVYAHREEVSQHRRARARLTALAEGEARRSIPIFCLGEFLRVITHPRLFDPPFTVEEVCEAVERILASPSLQVLLPGEHFWTLVAEVVRQARATGNPVFDAQIVALCRESGVSVLLTEDRDFERFAGFGTTGL